ncbi:hypothetical protein [Nostoc sp.]|uniref:hypothetical protein n=1 Tax=Nostoc sp. TaxID=1180 RepID=UPI002FFA5F53
MARIVVCGYMIRHPVAGNLLAFFHYVLGLHLLGHEVLYLEESGWPGSCYNPIDHNYDDDPSFGIDAVQTLINTYCVNATVCYVNRDTGDVYGADWQDIKQMLRTADLLLNIGGVCWLPEFLLCQRRVLIDMDPFFTQIGTFAAEGRNEYHAYFSYGANIGQPDCSIPSDRIEWLPTVPPVVPEIWQITPEYIREKPTSPFTTIANWNAYGGVTYKGEYYGQKDREFMRLLELPSYCSQKLELALAGRDAEIAEVGKSLKAAGWLVRDAKEISTSLSTYRSYLIGSRGEFSVAKQAYVKTRSGWFSDRSVCYLAAGRPVVLQDTGFSNWLRTGYGVLAFSSLAEAVDCIERVNADYLAHSLAAREIAEQTFSYKVVLPRLLKTAISARDELRSVEV